MTNMLFCIGYPHVFHAAAHKSRSGRARRRLTSPTANSPDAADHRTGCALIASSIGPRAREPGRACATGREPYGSRSSRSHCGRTTGVRDPEPICGRRTQFGQMIAAQRFLLASVKITRSRGSTKPSLSLISSLARSRSTASPCIIVTRCCHLALSDLQAVELPAQIGDLQLVIFLGLQPAFAVDRRLNEVSRHRARHGVKQEGRQRLREVGCEQPCCDHAASRLTPC